VQADALRWIVADDDHAEWVRHDQDGAWNRNGVREKSSNRPSTLITPRVGPRRAESLPSTGWVGGSRLVIVVMCALRFVGRSFVTPTTVRDRHRRLHP
jgi:hypothetical protein